MAQVSSFSCVRCVGLVFASILVAVPVGAQDAQAKLTASDGASGDEFGHVSLSGDIAVIGAPMKDDFGADSGVAYVFVRSGSTWSQEARLVPRDPDPGARFGFAAVDGNTAVIGAPGKQAAYVFVRSGSTWTEQAKLTATNGTAGDQFGLGVSVNRDTVVVGAPSAPDSTGTAYVFVRIGTTWTQQANLTPSDGASGDSFGSVSVGGDTAVIGAPGSDSTKGAAYVFVRTGSAWTEQAKLMAEDGAFGDQFGRGVSVHGDTAVVAAPFKGLGYQSGKGAAYVFVRAGTAWSQQAKLLASDGAPDDHLGAPSVSGETVVLGASGEDDLGVSSGAAYIYRRNGTVWSEHAKLTANDASPLDRFGSSVAVDGNAAIIGAFGDDDRGVDSGSAYAFDLESGSVPMEPIKPDGLLTLLPFAVGAIVLTVVVAWTIAWRTRRARGRPPSL